ncbi:MAG: hypothetical protein MJE12_05425, partial [Alphaproteobacteria bacterium]|nr:hypothetical protein [Alphaproteobacteria bacterium]
PSTEYLFQVALDAREKKSPNTLIGRQFRGGGKSKLVRIGDLPDFLEAPLEGVYDLELVASDYQEKFSGTCTLIRKDFFQPERYDISCRNAEGKKFKGQGSVGRRETQRHDGHGAYTLKSILRLDARFEIKGAAQGEFSFFADPWSSAGSDFTKLVGIPYSQFTHEVSRLTRTGDVDGLLHQNDFTPARFDLTGTWVGHCYQQGSLVTELMISDRGDNDLFALLRWSGKYPGSYLLKGSIDHETQEVSLTPHKWLKQSAIRMTPFRGKVYLERVSGKSHIRGKIQTHNCATPLFREDIAKPDFFKQHEELDRPDRGPDKARLLGLTGTWVGEYACLGTTASAELTLQGSKAGAIRGLFKFAYPVSVHTRHAPSGSYLVSGARDGKGNIQLQPGRWIDEPFLVPKAPISLRAARDDSDPDFSLLKLQGKVLDPKCGKISVIREESAYRSLPAETKPKPAGRQKSACTMDRIAGKYQSQHGVMDCKAEADAMRCCYRGGKSCIARVTLDFSDNGKDLVGTWKEISGRGGPVGFPLNEKCEIVSGTWRYDNQPADRSQTWTVTAKQQESKPSGAKASRASARKSQSGPVRGEGAEKDVTSLEPGAAPSIRTGKDIYAAKEPVAVYFDNAPTDHDQYWITIVPADWTLRQYAAWQYLRGNRSGQITLHNRYGPGLYEARLLTPAYELIAKSEFTVK